MKIRTLIQRAFLFLIIMGGLQISTTAQVKVNSDTPIPEKKMAITLGILQGGGGLIGFDIESIAYKRFGVQAGLGLVSYGLGINYHLKDNIRSSFISWSYWHQGFGNNFTQDAMGPTFVYRSKKWFTAQLGGGFRINDGPALPVEYRGQAFMLLYSVGAYFPL